MDPVHVAIVVQDIMKEKRIGIHPVIEEILILETDGEPPEPLSEDGDIYDLSQELSEQQWLSVLRTLLFWELDDWVLKGGMNG